MNLLRELVEEVIEGLAHVSVVEPFSDFELLLVSHAFLFVGFTTDFRGIRM